MGEANQTDSGEDLGLGWSPSALESSYDKISRAWDHALKISEMGHEWVRELGERTFVIPETDGHGSWTWSVSEVTPPHVRVGTLLGEVLHNLRSALDQIVCALVRQAGVVVHNRHSFVVCADEGKWRKETDKNQGALLGVPREALAVLRSVQPFAFPAPPRLIWVLPEYSNAEKHRSFIQTVHPPTQVKVEFVAPAPGWTIRPVLTSQQSISPGTVVARGSGPIDETVAPPIHLDMSIALAFGRFGDMNGMSTYDVRRLVEEVRDLVDAIAATQTPDHAPLI